MRHFDHRIGAVLARGRGFLLRRQQPNPLGSKGHGDVPQSGGHLAAPSLCLGIVIDSLARDIDEMIDKQLSRLRPAGGIERREDLIGLVAENPLETVHIGESALGDRAVFLVKPKFLKGILC